MQAACSELQSSCSWLRESIPDKGLLIEARVEGVSRSTGQISSPSDVAFAVRRRIAGPGWLGDANRACGMADADGLVDFYEAMSDDAWGCISICGGFPVVPCFNCSSCVVRSALAWFRFFFQYAAAISRSFTYAVLSYLESSVAGVFSCSYYSAFAVNPFADTLEAFYFSQCWHF